jgi:microsomal dipeptidase-like Zn-dependent dipeptidase
MRSASSPILAMALVAISVTAAEPGHASAPVTIHEPANGCFALQAVNGAYVERSGDGYAARASRASATPFFFEPTGLGSYLLLESYTPLPGQRGASELLGIADPGGALLDEAGGWIETAGTHVAAVGDIANYFLDPIEPAGDVVRDVGTLLGDEGDTVADVAVVPQVATLAEAADLAVWKLVAVEPGVFRFVARVGALQLGLYADGSLALGAAGVDAQSTRFQLAPASGCDAYPEAELGATLVPGRTPARYWSEVEAGGSGEVFGWVDAHAHVTANEFIGGRINYGAPFHEFGVEHAFADCAENHGPDGSTAHVHMVTSDDAMGPHETQGWPTFDAWPSHGDLMHHQSYYVWLQRAFLSGQKILVNLITHNEILCQIVPQKKNDCDGMANIRLQAQTTHALQDYVDAQHGGPGRGWFRIVRSPAEARAAIDAGQLAVVLGAEMSKVLNCGEFLDQPECTPDEMIAALDEIHGLGVRVVFPVHKFDNAFGGHLPHSGFAIGTVLTAGNLAETGHPLELEECPAEFDDDEREVEPSGLFDWLLWQLEYAGRQLPSDSNFDPWDPRSDMDTDLCNVRGLTDLGAQLTQALMDRRMIIDVDHMGRRAASHLIDLANAAGYPVISSHDWTGSERLLDRIAASPGFIARFARGGRASWVGRLVGIADRFERVGSAALPAGGLATDVNGIAHLPGDPRGGDAREIAYPFPSYDGAVLFDAQVTGERRFGLYDGRGVAHYGVYPDFIADAQHFGGPDAQRGLDAFYRSAEAYLQMWERAEGSR